MELATDWKKIIKQAGEDAAGTAGGRGVGLGI